MTILDFASFLFDLGELSLVGKDTSEYLLFFMFDSSIFPFFKIIFLLVLYQMVMINPLKLEWILCFHPWLYPVLNQELVGQKMLIYPSLHFDVYPELHWL